MTRREQRQAREELAAALRWLARRQRSPWAHGRAPEVHARVLRSVVEAGQRELAKRQRCGARARRLMSWCGHTFTIKYTSWERVLLIDRKTGAIVASGYGWCP